MAELDEQMEQLKLDTPIAVTDEEPEDYDYTPPPPEKQTGWGQFKKEVGEASDKYFDFSKNKLGIDVYRDPEFIKKYPLSAAIGRPFSSIGGLALRGLGWSIETIPAALTHTAAYPVFKYMEDRYPKTYDKIFGQFGTPLQNAKKLSKESKAMAEWAIIHYGVYPRTVPSAQLQKTKKFNADIKQQNINYANVVKKQRKWEIEEILKPQPLYMKKYSKKVYTTPTKKGAGTHIGKNVEPVLEKLNKKERPLEKERITAGKQPTLLEDIVVPKIEAAQKESKGFLQVLDTKLKEPWVLIKEQRVGYYSDLPRPKESRQYKTKGVGEIKTRTETGTLPGVKDYRRKLQTEGYEHGLQWLYESNYNITSEHYSFLNRLKNLPDEPALGNNLAVGYSTKGYEFRNIKLPSSKDTKPVNLNILKPHQLSEVPGRPLNQHALIEYLESLPKYPKNHPEAGRRIVVTKEQTGFNINKPVSTLSVKHVSEILAKAEHQGLIVNIKHKQGGKWVDGGYYWTEKGIEHVNKPLNSRIKIGPRAKTKHKDVILPHDVKVLVNKSISELKGEGFTTYQRSIREVLTKDEWNALVRETAKEIDPYVASQNQLLVKLQYDAGVRGGELRKLKISDITGKPVSRLEYHGGIPKKVDRLPSAGKAEGILNIRKEISKTEKARTTLLNPETLYLVAKHLKLLEKKFPNTEYLFPNIKNSQNPMSYRTHNTIVNKLATNAGIPLLVNTHTIRRTKATHMRQDGIQYEIVQEKMGHSSPVTTALYIKDSIENIKNLLHKYSGAETQILNLTPLEQIMTGIKQGKQGLPAPSVYIKGMESALNNLVLDGKITKRAADAIIKKLKVDIKLGVVKPSQLTNLVPKERALTVSKEYTAYKIETQQSRVLHNLEKNIKPIIKGDNRPIFETTDPLSSSIKYRLPLGTKWTDPVLKKTYKVVEGKDGKLAIHTVHTKSQLKEFKKKQMKFKDFE